MNNVYNQLNGIYEHANEQHLRAVEVYAGDTESDIYYDKEFSVKVPVSDALNLFDKGILVIVDTTNEYRCRPSTASVSNDDDEAVLFYCCNGGVDKIHWYSAHN